VIDDAINVVVVDMVDFANEIVVVSEFNINYFVAGNVR